MKTITQEQMDNLIMLRDVIEAKLGQPKWVLNTYFQPCGTYGCVAGDFFLKHRGVASLSEIGTDYFNVLWSYDGINSVTHNHKQHELFGYALFDIENDVEVFGMSHHGTIQQRLDFVNNLIANSKVETSEEDKAKAFIESLK